ncbi:MAG: hypothetical protein BWK79_04945 [Beggiatoa sp. IS2]|nr:MAG: hypothetical protein BWK79_04945 [Beggiatoa sp. IS2]
MRHLIPLIILLISYQANAARYITASEFNSCYGKNWAALQTLARTMYTLTREKKSVIFDQQPGPSFSSTKVSDSGFFLRASQDNCIIDFITLKAQCDIVKLVLDYGTTPEGYERVYLPEIMRTMESLGGSAETFSSILEGIVSAMVDAGDCTSEANCNPLSRVELPGIGLLAYNERPLFYTDTTTFDWVKPFYLQPEPPVFSGTCVNVPGGGGGTTTPDLFGYGSLVLGAMTVREVRTAPGTIGMNGSIIYQTIDASHASIQWKSPGSVNYGSPVTFTLGTGGTVTATNGSDWIKLEQTGTSNALPSSRLERSFKVVDNAFQPTVQITTATGNYIHPTTAPNWTEGASRAGTGSITVTATAALVSSGQASFLSDGATGQSLTFATITASALKNIKAVFQEIFLIEAFRLNQTANTVIHGVWNAECSQDGTNFVIVANRITLGSHEVYLPINTACKAFRLTGVSSSLSNLSTINELEFKLGAVITRPFGQDITDLFAIEHTPGTTDVQVNDGSKKISITY